MTGPRCLLPSLEFLIHSSLNLLLVSGDLLWCFCLRVGGDQFSTNSLWLVANPDILDLAADCTGTHSLYTTYKDYEIMFHVSTMLPYTPNNRQQVCSLTRRISTIGGWSCLASNQSSLETEPEQWIFKEHCNPRPADPICVLS